MIFKKLVANVRVLLQAGDYFAHLAKRKLSY